MTKYAVFGWRMLEITSSDSRESIIARSFGYLDAFSVLGTIRLLTSDTYYTYETEFEGEIYVAARKPFIDMGFRGASAIAEVLDENKLREHEKKLYEKYGLEILLIANKD